MLKPLAVQLYSLRQYSEKDFASVIKGVAEIGYVGVEPAGFFNIRPSTFRKVLADNGLEMVSSHTPWANVNNLGECMDIADSLGLKRIVCGYGPDDFKDLDAIKVTAEKTNKICEVLNANGFEVFQHNHYWEFERIDGRIKYDIYAEMVPNVKFQMDCFWSTNRGTEDAVEMLKKFADRTILLHMKDGVCKQQAKNDGMKNGLLDMKIDLLPLGTGTLPIPQLIAAAPEQVETVIVELDYCEVEMWKAIRESYEYMTRNGLARGRK